jgi:hypothetical protein
LPLLELEDDELEEDLPLLELEDDELEEDLPLLELEDDELEPPPVTVSDVNVGRPAPLAQNPNELVPPLAARTAFQEAGPTVTFVPACT